MHFRTQHKFTLAQLVLDEVSIRFVQYSILGQIITSTIGFGHAIGYIGTGVIFLIWAVGLVSISVSDRNLLLGR